MPKHNKPRNVRNVEVSPKLPFNAQVKLLRGALEEVKRQAAKMRRLLWLAVHKHGNRLEVSEAEYKDAMNLPGEDCIVGVEHDKAEKKIILVFTDEKGNRLEESDPPRVILTDPK